MPNFIENEGRYLASQLDQSRTNEVTNRLQQDAQTLGPGGYSQLLKTINAYEQKGVGDDLIIVNTQNGQEALIKPHAIDVGHVYPDAPPPPPQDQPQGYYNEAPPPPPRSDAGCVIGSTIVGGILGNIISGGRNKGIGTVVGAGGGAVVGSATCPH